MTESNEKFKVRLSNPERRLDIPAHSSKEQSDNTTSERSSGFELTEMDILYQQALNAMEEVESELNRTSEILLEDVDPENDEQEIENQEPTQDSEEDEKIILKLNPKSGSNVTPEMIVEALLFVGGQALTTKKLCQIIGGNADPDSMEKLIENLNKTYESQNRPYEIQFGEGGYRLSLKNDFQQVQNKVFGLGPREVKLSQEILEILALVAYKQPISHEEIDKTSKRSTNPILRQLLRRELIEIERNDKNRKNIIYKTTPRFLQVFGLTDLGELPQAEMIEYK